MLDYVVFCILQKTGGKQELAYPPAYLNLIVFCKHNLSRAFPYVELFDRLKVTTLKCTAGKLAIIVKDANGEEVQFEMNHKTKMGKVFKAYAEHKGLSPSAFRFLLQGERIVDDSTPRTLELEDGDLIDAVLEHAAC